MSIVTANHLVYGECQKKSHAEIAGSNKYLYQEIKKK